MAECDVSSTTSTVQSSDDFWKDLERIVTSPHSSYGLIDDSLRAWLYLVADGRDRFLGNEDDLARCSQKLIESPMVRNNRDYVRTQIIYSLLQEDESGVIHVIANFLLLDGRSDEATFRRMIEEGCFGRLLELLRDFKEHDRRLYRLVLELAYEMSRIERLRYEDLLQVDDTLVLHLFQMIESISDDMDDMYHYPVIRIILILNEQYMIASTFAADDPSNPPTSLTNRVLKILSVHGATYRTFGENLILLLNRETETSLQLLILKLLYLLFTTESTCEYFYTNDLRVLLDVIIRNLLDLPNELMSLRHTYLRVLYPLLAHTQLRHPPHYKREEILRLLRILGGTGSAHFAPADGTTMRLVARVSKVAWLGDETLGSAEVAQRYLGISMLQSQTASSASVVDIAAVKERPGVKTPSRKTELLAEEGTEEVEGPVQTEITRARKALPEAPSHRQGPLVKEIGHKRIPPKLPPPRRRTRLQITSMAGGESFAASEDVAASQG